MNDQATAWRAARVYVAIAGRAAGLIAIADPVTPDSALDQIIVTVVGLAAAGAVARFFWFKRAPGVRASTVSDGFQEVMILVKGGYTPDTIRVTAGRPVRLLFRREETAACSAQVVLPDFDRSAALPTGAVVPVEFLPAEPGEHQFTCQMGMQRGRIVVEAA